MSKTDQQVNQRDKVEQYIYNTSGPFDADTCSSATEVCIGTVRNYLKIFEDWGLVKKMRCGQKRVYVRYELTAKVKRKIKLAKMREAQTWLHEHELLYYFAGLGITILLKGIGA